jgi:uncharacterized membrane protein
MSDTNPGDNHLHRLILFSDAVFAIAITLLAIEIHPPEHWTSIGELFFLMGPKLAAYGISFAVIGIYWVSHRRLFERIARANGTLDALNFITLGLVALLWGYAAFVGKLVKPISPLLATYVLVRVALLPGLMCGLSFFSLVHPWGWGLMAAIGVGLTLAGRRIERLSAPQDAA